MSVTSFVDAAFRLSRRLSMDMLKLTSKVKVSDTGGVMGGGQVTDFTGRTMPFSTTVKSDG